MHKITLTDDEWGGLIMLLGGAAHAAYADPKHSPLDFDRVIAITNAINRHNPDWIPMQLKEK